MRRLLRLAGGVSYVSLVLTYFGIAKAPREAFLDLCSDKLPAGLAEKIEELLDCPYCVSFWVALTATKGDPLAALQVAGLASVPTSLVLLATKAED